MLQFGRKYLRISINGSSQSEMRCKRMLVLFIGDSSSGVTRHVKPLETAFLTKYDYKSSKATRDGYFLLAFCFLT